MQLTRVEYFADFYVYPCAAAILGALALGTAPRHWPALAFALATGLTAWSLLEYAMHRWVFHRAPWIREQHGAHHDDPKALVGTPTWLSVTVILAFVMLPAVLATGLALGSAFTAGLVLGYVGYGAVHHAAHHFHPEPRSAFAALKHRHAIHHHVDVAGNYGVTTPFWDHVFRTRVSRSPRASPPANTCRAPAGASPAGARPPRRAAGT